MNADDFMACAEFVLRRMTLDERNRLRRLLDFVEKLPLEPPEPHLSARDGGISAALDALRVAIHEAENPQLMQLAAECTCPDGAPEPEETCPQHGWVKP